MANNVTQPICIGCSKTPEELTEYVLMVEDEYLEELLMSMEHIPVKQTPSEFVIDNEGTYNRMNGHFTCTECYINMGMPSAPNGWVAP